jgi:hypothetical protein
MKTFISKLFASLDNHSLGYSGRKLSAMVGVLTGVYITIKLLPATDQLHALYAWLTFALLCLGIVTVEQIIKFKNGQTGAVTETVKTETVSETKKE